LGFVGYYWRFIEGFAKIVKSIISLLEKEREFKWDEKCQDSFDHKEEIDVTTSVGYAISTEGICHLL
jgi:hypothetical protein